MKSQKKRNIIIACLSVAVLAVGFTIAYNSDSIPFYNFFHPTTGRAVFTDEFLSPTAWQPCEDTEKHFTIKNDGTYPIAARFKMSEYWRKENSIYSPDDHETTELPLTWERNGVDRNIVTITTLTNSGWTYNPDDGYYYYNHDLAPGETTTSYIQSAMIDCDLNFGGDVEYSSNGLASESTDNDYHNATYHIYIEGEAIDATQVNHWNDKFDGLIAREIKKNAIDLTGQTLDYKAPAVVDSDPETANGNGIIPYQENGRTVYVYRGEINNNYVLWGNKCWRILRTTYTGGVKLVYHGEKTEVEVDGENVTQCDATSTGVIGSAPYQYQLEGNSQESIYKSPGDTGYMHGDRVEMKYLTSSNLVYTYSNNISRTGDIYTLDTATGQSITDTYSNIASSSEAKQRLHYFCMGGERICPASSVSYSVYGTNYYYPLGGYNNIGDFMDAVKAKRISSTIKTSVDSWFTGNHFDESDDLEDAIFCNDTSIIPESSLLSKDQSSVNIVMYTSSRYGGENFTPTLDCTSKEDAYTKDDAVNGNAKLSYKVGLLSFDEAALAGWYGAASEHKSYLNTGSNFWTMSPHQLNPGNNQGIVWGANTMSVSSLNSLYGIRPVVSLKNTKKFAGGDGTAANPYTIE